MPGDLAPPKAGQKSGIFDRLQATPKDNIEGIRTPKRQHSSRFDISDQRQRELEKLPGFHEVPPNKREELFMQKIDQCNIIFDFNDASGDMKSKEIKRLALHELLDYVANNRQVITEKMYPRVVEMFAKNLFRPIPPPMNPQGEAFDPEEDEPVLEVAWPHIQVVYEFFLRFIESQDFNTNIAKAYIDHSFVLNVSAYFLPLLIKGLTSPSYWSSSTQRTPESAISSKPPSIASTESSSTSAHTFVAPSITSSSNSYMRLSDSMVLPNSLRFSAPSLMALRCR
jgi:serine/threonine-protein phosphatase 2A regulatory subunit B'